MATAAAAASSSSSYLDTRPTDGALSVQHAEMTEIPPIFGDRWGTSVTRLDLSHNKIQQVSNLERFALLKNLVLDNNLLVSNQNWPQIPTLETLWVNNNNISDIKEFLDAIVPAFPNLSFLSLLKNPACPNPLIGADEEEYKRYRLYVLYRLPNLNFLDAAPVEEDELQEAKRRGAFCLVAKPAEIRAGVSAAAAELGGRMGPSEADLDRTPQSSCHYGVCHYYYVGRQSEGNRYIKNSNL